MEHVRNKKVVHIHIHLLIKMNSFLAPRQMGQNINAVMLDLSPRQVCARRHFNWHLGKWDKILMRLCLICDHVKFVRAATLIGVLNIAFKVRQPVFARGSAKCFSCF